MKLISKQQFLIEHNKLSPLDLQATFEMLTDFKEEKKPFLKDDGWCLEKLRMPFILWLLHRPRVKVKILKDKEKVFRTYPAD